MGGSGSFPWGRTLHRRLPLKIGYLLYRWYSYVRFVIIVNSACQPISVTYTSWNSVVRLFSKQSGMPFLVQRAQCRLTLDVSVKPQPHSIHFFWICVGCQLLISCPNSIFMHVQDNIITSKVLYGGGVLILDKGHPLGNALHFVL